MFFVLSKVLLFFTFPLTWILLCILGYLIFRKRKFSKWWLISAAILFFFFSNAFIYLQTLKAWEGSNDNFSMPIPATGDETYDAVVILGGYSSWNTLHEMVTFNYSSDRMIEGLKTYHTGISKKIILSGGSGLLLKPDEKESIWMKDYLTKLKVRPEDIYIEGESRNTYENAEYTADLIRSEFDRDGKYLLITSAYHMKRARACFEKTGIDFDYYRVGFLVDTDDYTALTYLMPSAIVLESWQMLIKEWLGYVVYAMKGYL